jgi:hypothetical protein
MVKWLATIFMLLIVVIQLALAVDKRLDALEGHAPTECFEQMAAWMFNSCH